MVQVHSLLSKPSVLRSHPLNNCDTVVCHSLMRRCFLEPIPELSLAAGLLGASADALLSGNRPEASRYLVEADIPEIMEYTIRIVGPLSLEIHRQTKRPKALSKDQRDPRRMPTQKVQEEIFERDGWRCCFCGVRVISRKARAILIGQFPAETHWLLQEFERHSALYALGVSLDHVHPHSRGGTNDNNNFVTSCYCCQFGRGEWTLEESELIDPRMFEPIVDRWDGLKRLHSFPPKPEVFQ